ncbi:unnamed protein product [Leuciscus chuanchicus]
MIKAGLFPQPPITVSASDCRRSTSSRSVLFSLSMMEIERRENSDEQREREKGGKEDGGENESAARQATVTRVPLHLLGGLSLTQEKRNRDWGEGKRHRKGEREWKERPPATLKLLSGSCVRLLPTGTKGLYVWLRRGAVGGQAYQLSALHLSQPPPKAPATKTHTDHMGTGISILKGTTWRHAQENIDLHKGCAAVSVRGSEQKQPCHLYYDGQHVVA